MTDPVRFLVVLAPRMEVVALFDSYAEARAWADAYRAAMEGVDVEPWVACVARRDRAA